MFSVTPIPAFQDNYLWLITREGSDQAAIVDPGDAAPVRAALEERGLTLCAILATHHHGDHVGGVTTLLEAYPGIPVYGPAQERISGRTESLQENDNLTVPGLELVLRVLDVPGHTAGHIAYVGEGMVFCGDTLFAVGCGRLFEGTPEQMHASLAKLAALPADTRVYCGHEYTESNIRFARRVEPANPDLAAREQEVHGLRQRGQPTLPSTIEWELRTNPFLRVGERGVAQAASERAGKNLASPVAVFAEIRRWKDAG